MGADGEHFFVWFSRVRVERDGAAVLRQRIGERDERDVERARHGDEREDICNGERARAVWSLDSARRVRRASRPAVFVVVASSARAFVYDFSDVRDGV